MKQTLSLFLILALCALFGPQLPIARFCWSVGLVYPVGLSIIATAVAGAVGFISHEIRNSVDAGD